MPLGPFSKAMAKSPQRHSSMAPISSCTLPPIRLSATTKDPRSPATVVAIMDSKVAAVHFLRNVSWDLAADRVW